jgi:glycyl-tRNA synthetase beta chain
VIRLVLTNGLRLHLDRLVDAQLLRHQITPSDDKEAALLRELLGEVADHGVFGAAVRAVIDRIDDAPGWLSKIVEHKPDVSDDLLSFFHDRLKVHLRDEGLRHDVIDACLAMPGSDDLALLTRRAQALGDVLKTEEGENLVQGFKRANNILSQAEENDGVSYEFGADKKFAEHPSEEALFDALQAARPEIDRAIEAEDFAAAMTAMAGLRGPIDAFFEAVQVNSDKEIVRRNRLNLLSTIRSTCLAVADLTKLEG